MQARLVDIGDGGVRVALPAHPSAVTTARRLISERWGHLPIDTLGDVELIVAELVSNAVRHGRPEIELRLRERPFALDVGVLDHHAALPPSSASLPDDDAHAGRGLFMVDTLAQSWGVDPMRDGTGKMVWACVTTAG